MEPLAAASRSGPSSHYGSSSESKLYQNTASDETLHRLQQQQYSNQPNQLSSPKFQLPSFVSLVQAASAQNQQQQASGSSTYDYTQLPSNTTMASSSAPAGYTATEGSARSAPAATFSPSQMNPAHSLDAFTLAALTGHNAASNINGNGNNISASALYEDYSQQQFASNPYGLVSTSSQQQQQHDLPVPQPSASTSSTQQPQPKKRGRKKKESSISVPGSGHATPSDARTSPTGDGGDDRDSKRQKTSRACDGCRTRKIRCDVLQDESPPLCVHCKQHNFNCSWVRAFLAVT